MQIACSYDFSDENRFLPILCVYFHYVPNFAVVLRLWRNRDVIRRRMVFILVSMERGDPLLYSGSKHKGIGRLLYNKEDVL